MYIRILSPILSCICTYLRAQLLLRLLWTTTYECAIYFSSNPVNDSSFKFYYCHAKFHFVLLQFLLKFHLGIYAKPCMAQNGAVAFCLLCFFVGYLGDNIYKKSSMLPNQHIGKRKLLGKFPGFRYPPKVMAIILRQNTHIHSIKTHCTNEVFPKAVQGSVQ